MNQNVDKSEKEGKTSVESIKEVSQGGNVDGDRLSGDLAMLSKRVEKNENNIMDNIKDINLINSELKDAKDDIEELKKKLSLFGNTS